MEFFEEKLSTPIMDEYDLIVVGGGPAGIGAAITAGRKGLKTLIIERYGFFGGTWTAALVNPFFDTANKGGLVREMVDELTAQGNFGAFWGITYDFEAMKKMLDEKIAEAGVKALFHTVFSGVMMKDNRVTGVIVQNKGGRMAFKAKYVIDCTGDGDVAVAAGADFTFGKNGEGTAQAMTTMFLLSGVKLRQTKQFELYELMKKACAENDTGYTIDFDSPYAIWLPKKDFAVVQLVHIRGRNGTDPFDLSIAETEGRKRAYETFELFKKYIPEFKDAELVMTAPQIGVRETRHILGDYTVTIDDMRAGATFEDSLGFKVGFNVDVHGDDDKQECFKVKAYEIPLRCLIPKGLAGILTAGRCISGDFYAHASYRVTGDCVAMGEGAATAITQAIRENKDIREIKKIEFQFTEC